MKAERPSPVVAGVGAWLLILSAAVWDTRRAAPRAKAHSLGAEVVDQVLQPPQEEHAEKQQRDTMMAELRQNITVTLRNEMMVELKAHDQQTRKMARVGFVPVAAHAELAARVAQLEHTNAELAQNCSATGATAFESQKSAELIEHAVDRLGVRVLTVENLLQTNRSVDAREGRTWRQMQETTGHGEYVLQIKRNVTRCGAPGAGNIGDHFDMSRCADHTFQQCNRKACIGYNGDHSGGHRRAQSGTCAAGAVAARADAINTACCDESGEDCSAGHPHTCNEDCAAQLLPFWDDCQEALGPESASQFGSAVALCRPPSLAEQLNVQCTDGTPTEDCVPTCTRELNGFLLLMNIDGEDTKLTCELHHGLDSWVGAASGGGYLGSDVTSFYSAVTVGAAGSYFVTLTQDADITSNLFFEQDQFARIAGDRALGASPSWAPRSWSLPSSYSGNADFRVKAGATLSLENLLLSSPIVVLGTATISNCNMAPAGYWAPSVVSGGALTYVGTLDEPRRSSEVADKLSFTIRSMQGQDPDRMGSTLTLDHLTLVQAPELGEMNGVISVGRSGSLLRSPPTLACQVTPAEC